MKLQIFLILLPNVWSRSTHMLYLICKLRRVRYNTRVIPIQKHPWNNVGHATFCSSYWSSYEGEARGDKNGQKSPQNTVVLLVQIRTEETP